MASAFSVAVVVAFALPLFVTAVVAFALSLSVAVVVAFGTVSATLIFLTLAASSGFWLDNFLLINLFVCFGFGFGFSSGFG